MNKETEKKLEDILGEVGKGELTAWIKDACSCKKCKYFHQHYCADGTPLNCGHCVSRSHVKHTTPITKACAFWERKE